MKYRNKMYAAASLILIVHFLSGCGISKSETPSVEILIDALNVIQNNHEGAYKFSGIKKLDGQLSKDGLHYVMDYQANIETYKCFTLPRVGYGEVINFSKPTDTKTRYQSRCVEQKEGFASYLGSTVTFQSGAQIQFQSKAIFTKKESGWQVIDLNFLTKTFRK